MAPKRRTSSGPVSKSSQSTLSFNNKNRITKPISAPSKDLKSSKPKTDPVIVEPLVSNREKTSVAIANDAPQISAQDIETEPTTAEAAILQQAEQEKQRIVKAEEPTAEEKQAREVSDAKIKAYWREKERQSKAPRVHQQDLSLEEKVLREWDVSGDYGPCIGIARMKRWQRAHELGLEPPIEVLAVLLKEQERENMKSQRAYLDELMSSRFNET